MAVYPHRRWQEKKTGTWQSQQCKICCVTKICIQRRKKKTSVRADNFLGINFSTGYHELLRGDMIGLLPGTSVQG